MLAAPLPIFALAVPAASASVTSGRVVIADSAAADIAGTHATRTGAVSSSQKVGLEISLNLRNQAGLDAFIKAVSDPRSASYKHYLTVKQFVARYAPTQAQIDQVTSYLKSEGLSVGALTGNHLTIAASGTAAQVEKAFNVSIGTYKTSTQSFYANSAAPSLPASIASVVSGVAGLNTEALHVSLAHKESTSAAVTSHAGTTMTPTTAREAYNLTTDITTDSYNGSGKTIALAEFSAYAASDVAKYNTTYSLGVTAASVVKVDGGTTDTSGEDEDELDIEVDYALAPKSTIKVYEAPNSDAGEVALYSALASADTTAVSSSWGEPETEENNLSSDDADFKEMAAQGQSMFAASGDSGADDNGSSLSVDYPASDPYVSGVGGTDVTVSSGAWSSETAWSDSGGGISVEWATPSYQTAVNSGSYRDVPDVAAAGAEASPWYIYTEGGWYDVWGTSAAAPNWAAFIADYDTAATSLGGSKFGYVNSFIYPIGEGSLYSTVMHDVTSGSNGGYSAGTGYDKVSGWGSYNGGKFISNEL
ncbi:S8/S53 family peptidase [Actinospica sp. MGRD01-02]|uniref:S8/S53 family peptidase n=1 Tax=Actinospica acidithermotolerans TaxID=2828514 RepID=A0A941EB65_9ACTN|nr:S53 family peptidase [Actinospica acidithermotolerans]MBR7829580.1 S8/S53 family peptidase [Actinospica acidithermotolerans]